MNTLSPLQRRAELMLQTHVRIDKFLKEVLATPMIYKQDVIDELTEAVHRLTANTLPLPPTTHCPPSEGSKSPTNDGESGHGVDGGEELRKLVLHVFKTNGNTPLSISELAENVGAKRKAVQTMIYKRSYGQWSKTGVRRSHLAPVSLFALTELGLNGEPDYSVKNPDGIERRPTKPGREHTP